MMVPHEEIARELNRLAGAYPAFRFRTQGSPRSEGLRWVAKRIDGLNPGLHTVITPDLRELHAALAGPDELERRRLRRDAALSALL